MSSQTQDFYGAWSLEVATNDAWLLQQIRLSGTDGTDGDYPGTPGTLIQATGDHWQLTMQWRDPGGGDWQPSRIRRLSTFTAENGLEATLGADDSPAAVADGDYNDMTVLARYRDHSLDPPQPDARLYDFTVTEGMFQPE
jgi:hypothetical protein